MEEYKKIFREKHKLNSLVACTLSNAGDKEIRELCINKSYINPDTTNGLHMMSGTYLYTNPPPYGYGTPAPYVAATVLRAHDYNLKEGDCEKEINGHKFIDVRIPDIKDFPRLGITGNFNPSIVWMFAVTFLTKNTTAIINCAKAVIEYLKSSNSDVLSKGRQTWDPELMKSTTCSKAFNGFLNLIKRNLGKTPSTLMEALIYWYELYNCNRLTVIKRKRLLIGKNKFYPNLKMRVKVTQAKYKLVMKTFKNINEGNKWLDDYARSFCSYIKHAERGKKDRRAIASGSTAMRLHLKIVEEFHLKLAKLIPGSTISIGGEEKKKKIMNESQMSSLKETFTQSYSLQATEDASKWNECLNPLLFAIVHKCWFDEDVRKQNCLPEVTVEEKTFSKVCIMAFYYMLIKRINLGLGFLLNNEHFYTRLLWNETKASMLNKQNRKWFERIEGKVDEDDYISSSPGFLMGMLNAGSTTIGLMAICGINPKNTVTRSLRSSDDSMTVFVADSAKSLFVLITMTYSIYRLFGINPSKEKTILFPESFGEYTSWYLDVDFVGQYGVETSSLKPMGKNPQDDFNSVASNTLQLLRTHIINVLGAMSRLIIGVNNVRQLWNIKQRVEDGSTPENQTLTPDVIFLSDGGKNPWTIDNVAADEATIRYNNIQNEKDREYFYKIMDPENPFSEPAEEQLLFNKDVGLLVSSEDCAPRNVFCYIRKSNRTNKDKMSKEEAKTEKANQEAFEIITAIDPSFLLTIPSSKTPLQKYLASTMLLLKEKLKHRMTLEQQDLIDSACFRLTESFKEADDPTSRDFDEMYDNL